MSKDVMYYVYVLLCNDQTYYVGHTNSLERRLSEHSQGIDKYCYTFFRRPVKMIFSQECVDRLEAFTLERKIKNWSKAKKKAFIQAQYDSLCSLSKKKF